MKTNVWIWNHYATNMAVNRAGRHHWFAESLQKRGYNPVLFAANTFHREREPIALGGGLYKEEIAGTIPYVYVRTIPGFKNNLSRILNMGLFYKNLFPTAKHYAKKHGRPDVILASSVHPLTMVAGIRIARKLNVPCICEVRDLWPEAIFAFGKTKETSILGKMLIKGEHWIYKNADAMIFTKEGDVDYIKEKKWDTAQGGDINLAKCHYINNGVDLRFFEKSIKEYPLDDPDLSSHTFKVTYTGSLRPVNNVGNMLDAAKLLKAEEDILFLVFGSGSEESILQQRVKEEGLGNVKLKGRIAKRHIPYVLSKSAVNLLNYSQTQYNWARGNSSNKLFEYMASGKPVISTVQMGYNLLDRYQCGLSLKENTAEQLARAILTVKNMPEQEYVRMGQNALEGVKDFDFQILTDKLIEVIESV